MSAEIQKFLENYPEEIQRTSNSLREIIRGEVPKCTETLHIGWKVISYGNPKQFCAIAPHKKWVNLQFHSGASLADVDGLLEGTGKSMRHVKVFPGDLRRGISTLLLEAAELAI